MGASIQENSHLTVTTTRQNDRTASHATRAKITRLRNLRFMPSVDPALLEDALVLQSQYLRATKCLTIDTKESGFTVINNETFERDRIHAASFRGYTEHAIRNTWYVTRAA